MNRANNFPAPAVQEETWMRKAASKIDLLDPGRVKPLDEIDPTTGHIPDECVQGRMVGHSVYNCPACLVERCESCGEWPWNGCAHDERTAYSGMDGGGK